MNKFKEFLNFSFEITDKIHLDVKTVIFIIFVIVITSMLLKLIRKLVNRRLDEDDKGKFKAIFTFLQYFVYVIVLIIALESSGIEVGVLLAGSAALLVGIGLGLQTLFQDIISGIFILLDKTLTVNDIVEVDEKVGKIIEIRLRTTRALTIDDKVLIIPNHKFLTQSLFNWTQNGVQTTEGVEVGVAYGSDVELVRKILVDVAKAHPKILKSPEPKVLFTDFGDSALQFKLLFNINNSYTHLQIKSDLRFEIDKKFRENNVTIPFPQRDVHLIK
ncbi:mechanosensitive ion channel family protein [Polaribacter aquimarinus]|uniref:Mechanosensitive ion channel protein MscS n=1 Tax=Polaribacter aquimarinus TaxID=2100726 RepID=A0A2U2JAG1_9FLAO|nr:mechanosensitive ion channel domain-containing protein [Polaribacter aquimarinus]PWG05320.1 mechanosensitive ion channel protein MscS [Polaribacter aquimarinus]